MQLVLVLLIIAISLAYAGWRIHQSLTHKADPCAGCAGCSLKGKIKVREQCPSTIGAKSTAKAQ